MNHGVIPLQCYDEQGRAIPGKTCSREDAFRVPILHGASHVWIWRNRNGVIEILVQKRSANKRTWPNCYDISAAGHIDPGEDAITAALRETREEIGLELVATDLHFVASYNSYQVSPLSDIEHEIRFVYLYELRHERDDDSFKLQADEVAGVAWIDFDSFVAECGTAAYVSHSPVYYQLVIEAITRAQQ
jgi:isopentenyldiphosphate isomerase